MDCKQLLGKAFDCDCGKQHTIPTEIYLFGEDAYWEIDKVAAKFSQGDKYLLVADCRTFKAAGKRVKNIFLDKGVAVEVYIIPDKGDESPSADDLTRDVVINNAPEADLYIAVGSGVVNDLVKWVSYLKKKPYITIPTASSMNGYGSANVAASIDGLKVLFHADACKAALVDPEVLYQAPHEMTTSGLGDVLAKSVSSADWKLNQFLFNDYYCQFSVDLLKDLEPVYLNNPKGIRDKEPGASKALFEALFYSSIAMTITGTSSPASGGEHLISHTLDMTAVRDNISHDLHGRQVGVASILMAALYQKVMAMETPAFVEPPKTINADFWGSLSHTVEGEYEKKLPKMLEVAERLSDKKDWDSLRQRIRPDLIDPAKLKSCLKVAGGAHIFSQIRREGQPLELSLFMATVRNANQMRARFTILDLAVLTGIIPDSIDQLIDEWVA